MSAPCPVNSNTSISFPLYLGEDLSTGSPTNTGVGCGFITWSLARQPHLLARALDHKPAAVMCFTAGAFRFFILSNPAIGRCKESLRLLLGQRTGGLGGGTCNRPLG